MQGFKCCWEVLVFITVYMINDTLQYKPVFLMHGVFGTAEADYTHLVARITLAHPGTIIHNSNVYPFFTSTTPLPTQIRGDLGQEFLNFSRTFKDGFHLVGFSQGGILTRALVETYEEHNVHNYISISGPLAGEYGPVALNNRTLPYQAAFLLFYNPAVQRSFSISNYWNDPNQHALYLSTNIFLPYIDNELQSNMSETYKRGFTKLRNLVCIGGPDDGVILPWQSSHFSFVDENETVINYKDRDIYKKDNFGLRTLDESGRFHVFEKSGVQHTEWTKDDDVIDSFILPFLD